MPNEVREHEIKYAVDHRFRLPNLAKLVPAGGRIDRASVTLESIYYDTVDRDLLAHGVTLRNRSGDSDSGWQLKVPDGDARTEIRLAPTDSRVEIPAELLELTSGLRRGADLRRTATVRTRRDIQRLLDAEENVLVEVADDQVHSTAPTADGALLQEWREIEAEFGSAATPEVVAAIDKRLIKSGAAHAKNANKVAQALQDGTVKDAPKSVGRKHPRTAGTVVSDYIREQDDALVVGDLMLRRGLGAIHSTRVASRRLRSTLKIFGPLFDAGRSAQFDAELSWYANLLGDVRDREVQRGRLRKLIADLPDELVLGPVAARVEQLLLAEQSEARRNLEQAMNSERYFALLQESRRWAAEPPLTDKAAAGPAAIAGYFKKAEKKLARHLAAGLRSGGDDEELHKARKAGKRARYAAELATSVLGNKTAKHKIARYQKLQDTLGEHQDGVVTSALMRRLGAAAANDPDQNGFTYGLIFAQESERATHSRLKAAKQFAALKH
jgi:CHAD domain-containing protein